ncbi:uncharacterized protein LOC124158538 [Ischnura elegans]|uniref:uncharacterized protein LOC124158538 n=1 Tax=Ischnura elegans TaxID=197161 RepID=UPI001ED8A6A5|nr:uncharacterized protein LOC124158538 [Ischnura elegans]
MDEPPRKDHIIAAAKNFLGTSDFQLDHYNAKPVSDKIVGFMGKHLLVTVTVWVEGKKQDILFFVKMLPTSESHRSFLAELRYFQKEIAFYEVFEPIMTSLLPSEHPLPIPSCYFTVGGRSGDAGPPAKSEDTEMIILEDVSKKGYVIRDKMIPLDLEHARIVMRTIARFHAASFLMKSNSPSARRPDNANYMDEVFLPAKEMFLTKERTSSGYQWAMATAKTTSSAVAGFWPEHFGSDEKKEEIRQRVKECWGKLFQITQPSEKYFNVLCHGDVWVNNIMFRDNAMSGKEKKPVDALLVDLQLIRFAPVAIDLLLFLHTSTTRKFRQDNLNELLEEYHKQLGNIVGKKELDELMSLEKLKESMSELGLFGKVIATGYLPFILNIEEVDPFLKAGSQEPPDFMTFALRDRGEKVLANAKASEHYKVRLMEAYQEILEHLKLWK